MDYIDEGLIDKFFKKKDTNKPATKKEENTNKSIDINKYKNHPLFKKTLQELNVFGEKVAKEVVKHLKQYSKENNFSKKYTMFDMGAIKYEPINGFDVQISYHQSGVDYDKVMEWEKKNPGKDWNKEPSLSTDWYYDLLEEGEKYAKEVFNKLNTDGKFDLCYCDTGDGDEATIYIEIYLNKTYIDKLCREEKGDTMNESVEYIDEGAIKKFFKKMDSKWVKNDYYVDYLTKEEFETVIDIIKTTFKKYEMVDKNMWYSCDTYDKYKKANTTHAYVADFDYSYFTKGRAGLNGVERQFHEAISEINKAIKETGIKTRIDYMPYPRDNYNTIILYSEKRKSKEDRKRQFANESSVVAVDEAFGGKFFKKKGEKEYYTKGAYSALSKEDFSKCVSIIKDNINRSENVKKVVSYINDNYRKYITNPTNDELIATVITESSNKYVNVDSKTITNDLANIINTINKDFSKYSLNAKVNTSSVPGSNSIGIYLLSTKEKEESTNESAVVAVDEVFGIRSKEERQAERRKLDEVELAYDRKFNSTCLRISGYPVERLEGTLSKCKSDLEAAKQEKKSAKDRYSKLEAQVKIDYYDNLSNKIITMIKKKKSSSK